MAHHGVEHAVDDPGGMQAGHQGDPGAAAGHSGGGYRWNRGVVRRTGQVLDRRHAAPVAGGGRGP